MKKGLLKWLGLFMSAALVLGCSGCGSSSAPAGNGNEAPSAEAPAAEPEDNGTPVEEGDAQTSGERPAQNDKPAQE